jgi:hypothetical protein
MKIRRGAKRRIDVLPIGHTLDSKSPFLKLQEIITFGKGDDKMIAEVRLEGLVPKYNSPMLNVFTRAQDSF